MGLNQTPSGERLHIGIFGRRNAGKSSLINAITGQQLAVVSDIAGTTTDPVSKAMELLPLGPVMITDTAGIDDNGDLGNMRVDKSYRVMQKTDIALLVTDSTDPENDYDKALEAKLREMKIPFIKVFSKCDLLSEIPSAFEGEIYTDAVTGKNIHELKEMIGSMRPDKEDKKICADLINSGDTVILVVPIDSSAPKGRLILPQQQTIRDILDSGAISIVCRDTELEDVLLKFKEKPRLVITDSQAFGKVSKIVPEDIMLTSFSILFARYKGNLKRSVEGVKAIDTIADGDKILISEGCTHHRQCEDIGTVKIPNWIKKYTGKNPVFEFTSGGDFPDDLSDYKMIIHCGACTLNEREMQSRIQKAVKQNIPITNYGICIAYLNGILKRSVKPFDDIYSLL